MTLKKNMTEAKAEELLGASHREPYPSHEGHVIRRYSNGTWVVFNQKGQAKFWGNESDSQGSPPGARQQIALFISGAAALALIAVVYALCAGDPKPPKPTIPPPTTAQPRPRIG